MVPHNPYLCAKYDCHINVEVTSSIKAVKHLYKYVYKGHDRVTMGVTTEAAPMQAPAAAVDGEQAVDKIQNYLDARYVSAPEACWRLFGFSLHAEIPAVTRLAVHLPDEQFVTYRDNDPLQQVVCKQQKTTLTEWFALNLADETAPGHLYHDMPTHYVWKGKAWKKRRRHAKMPTIGRVASCSSRQGERFYLRLLLQYVRGARSFVHVRTHEGTVHATFKDAARARGLLQDDAEWDACLAEALTTQSGQRLRRLFADLLIAAQPAEPRKLWDKYREDMTEDILHKARLVSCMRSHELYVFTNQGIQSLTLLCIATVITQALIL